jgi:hypothetical protein
MQRPRWALVLRWLPLIAVVALFGRAVTFGFVEWDDAKYIRSNPLIAGPLPGVETNGIIDYLFTPQMGYVVPVTVALERLLYLLGGGAAWPFHLASVLLHGLSALLVARIAETLGASPTRSVLAALLWACHPIVAEPVSWATGLKDVLAVCLVLGSTLA